MRKSLLCGVLVMLVAAAALVVIGEPQAVKAQGITVDRSLLALLPAQATSLVGVDVERLKGTLLYRHFEEQSRKGDSQGRNHLDEFTVRTGFDPRRDVEQLLIASWVEGSEPQFVAVARGRFPVSNLSQFIRNEKAAVESYRGIQIFGPPTERVAKDQNTMRVEKRRSGKHRDDGAFAFLDERTAVAGSRVGVHWAIDRKVGGGPSLLANSALLNRAQAINSSSQIWAVSVKPGEVITKALPEGGPEQASNFARIFSSMQNTVFALDLMNGLELRASGVCKTAEDAKTLGDAARGAVAFGRLAASQKEPEMMAVLDTIRVEERGQELDLTVQMDRPTLEKLLEKSTQKARPAAREAKQVKIVGPAQ